MREDPDVSGAMVGFSQWEREWLLFELMGWLKQLGLTSYCYLGYFAIVVVIWAFVLFFGFSGLGLLKSGCSKFYLRLFNTYIIFFSFNFNDFKKSRVCKCTPSLVCGGTTHQPKLFLLKMSFQTYMWPTKCYLIDWTLETSCTDSDQESKTNSGVGLKKNQEMNMHEPEE